MAEFGGWVPKSEAWTWNVGTAAMGINGDTVLPMGVLKTGCTSLLQYGCAHEMIQVRLRRALTSLP